MPGRWTTCRACLPSCLARVMVLHNHSQVSGGAHSNFAMANASYEALLRRCAAACCTDTTCVTWGLDEPLTHCNGCWKKELFFKKQVEF